MKPDVDLKVRLAVLQHVGECVIESERHGVQSSFFNGSQLDLIMI
jgi:hypothetical protein